MLKVIRNANVFAPEPLGCVSVVVCGERVELIGAEIPEIPSELITEEIDIGGRSLIPGLIDCHAHLTGGGGEAGPGSQVPALQPSHFTRAGITTAIGVLGTDDLIRQPASLVAAARGLVAEGISAWCHTGGYHLPPATLTGSVRGDIVQIDRMIGFGELAISDHRSSQPTLDELLRLASDCHVAGLMTGKAGILHLHLGDGDRGLDLVRRALEVSEIPARVFHPTHVNRRKALFEEAIELAGSGCSIDVTAFPKPSKGADEWSAEEAFELYSRSGAPAHRLTISSDGGGCLPSFNSEGRVQHFDVGQPSALVETLSTLAGNGHRLEQILPPITCNVADLLRLPGKGRIAAGADADLVVLDERHQIAGVMARGRWHVRNGKQRLSGRFEKHLAL